jgi:hypothetical protein
MPVVDLSMLDPVVAVADNIPVRGSHRRFSIMSGLMSWLVKETLVQLFFLVLCGKEDRPPEMLYLDL